MVKTKPMKVKYPVRSRMYARFLFSPQGGTYSFFLLYTRKTKRLNIGKLRH